MSDCYIVNVYSYIVKVLDFWIVGLLDY